MLLTVNGKVQAVLVDPVTYQKAEEQLERAPLFAAIRAGELDIQAGRTRPAEDVFADIKAKHGLYVELTADQQLIVDYVKGQTVATHADDGQSTSNATLPHKPQPTGRLRR